MEFFVLTVTVISSVNLIALPGLMPDYLRDCLLSYTSAQLERSSRIVFWDCSLRVVLVPILSGFIKVSYMAAILIC